MKLVKLSNGSAYSGLVKEGKPHGMGKEYLSDGATYIGNFNLGLWDGMGKLIDPD